MNKSMCFYGDEYLDICPVCKGEVKIVEEGTFLNPKADVVECDCSRWEIPNSLTIMGGKLTFGTYKKDTNANR